MRLVSLEVSGFRGFPRRQEFDLNADAVVVVGSNGNGKTSLLDGILWALSGRIPRLATEDDRLVSLYSETGQARVALRLRNQESNRGLTVTRSFDGKEARFTLETPEGSFQGPSAEGRLIDLIWPDAASASDPREALASVLTRSVYLEQDLIRQFVEAATKEERFNAISELVGAGRVTELQSSLEQAKRAWSTVTNQRQDELRLLRERLTTIDARLAEMETRMLSGPPSISSEEWTQWWAKLKEVGVRAVPVEPGTREAPSAIDAAIKQLDALRRSSERRAQALAALRAEIANLARRDGTDVEPLRHKVATLNAKQDDLKSRIAEEQGRLADIRRQQAELKEKNEQLRALASLALKHLSDHCPVCEQTYDREATRLRLEEMASSGRDQTLAERGLPDTLTNLLDQLASNDKELAAAESSLRFTEQALAEGHIMEQSISKRLDEFGMKATDNRGAFLDSADRETENLLTSVIGLQRAGESLSLRLSESSAAAAMNDLRREAETLRREQASREKTILDRNLTGDLGQRVIEALREASSAVVQERLRQIGPLLQSIWTRIDPHPAFRIVTFFSQVFRGKGQLSTMLTDPIEEKESVQPAAVLSSSQLNALAVSVFLALNLGVPRPPLNLVMLDDPLQSLDDVNLLGLVDLFRRTRARRQLLISTHDPRYRQPAIKKTPPRTSKRKDIGYRTRRLESRGAECHHPRDNQ
jgi:DNA repair exonuclease SbcCD ATPase subunit